MRPFAFSLGLALKKPKKSARPQRRYWTFCEGQAPGKDVHYMRPGETDRRHVITLIVATLKKGGSQLLTVQDEGKMCLRSYCHDTFTISSPLPIRSGKAVTVFLNCHEDLENVASLTVWGYTEDQPADQDAVLS